MDKLDMGDIFHITLLFLLIPRTCRGMLDNVANVANVNNVDNLHLTIIPDSYGGKDG